MKIRKKMVVGGTIAIVVSVSLFFYGLNSTFWLTMQNATETIPINKFYVLNVPGVESGMKVYAEYTASDEVNFYILDESDYTKFEIFLKSGTGTDYQYVYNSKGESESYTFNAPKDDTYYAVLIGSGDNDVSVTVKISTERIWINGMIYFFSFLLVIIGLIATVGGLIAKPKADKVASKLQPEQKPQSTAQSIALTTYIPHTKRSILK